MMRKLFFRIQAETWLATYPNAELGVSYEGVRQRVEGLKGEKVAKKIDGWRERIKTAGEDHAVFVARDHDRIVGFVTPGNIEGQRRIGALYVLPDAQGLGVGSKLLEKALEWNGDSEIYLHVAEYNDKAVNFYQKFGFELTGRRFEDEDGKALGASIPELEMVRRPV
jgi:ribosomal protein S18 acetylase RimI-like enzyme